MRSLSGDGKQLRKRVQGFPLASELASSRLLLIFTATNGETVAACGIRSLFNVLVLFVKRGYRGRGLGTEVLERTIDTAKSQRLSFITLSVSSDNATAFHLYSKCGFKKVAHLRKSSSILMLNPLDHRGQLLYEFLKRVCSVLPNSFLASIHEWLYRRTYRED